MSKISAKVSIVGLYLTSIFLFIMGITHPIMKSETFFGLKEDSLYLLESVEYFFEEGELFLGILILTFTFILPILKYIVLALKLLNISFIYEKGLSVVIEIINKWAMLDVFVVAIIIVNFKMDSLLIKTENASGTGYFAASVLLLMICSFLLKKQK